MLVPDSGLASRNFLSLEPRWASSKSKRFLALTSPESSASFSGEILKILRTNFRIKSRWKPKSFSNLSSRNPRICFSLVREMELSTLFFSMK